MIKFAIIIHPTSEELLYRYEPGMKRKPRALVKKVLEWMPPFKASKISGLCSSLGKKATGFFVMCPLLTEQMFNLKPKIVFKAVLRAVHLAENLGAQIIGLTAFTSLVGNKGKDILSHIHTPITTGNHFTLAMIPEAILRGINLMGLNLAKTTVLIIGAIGSIGRVCLEILGRGSKRIYLASRSKNKIKELIRVYSKQMDTPLERPSEIPKASAASEVIIFAANINPHHLIDFKRLKPGTVIFDASYPRRIPKDIREDVLVIDGLTIKPPGEVKFNFDFGLPEGLCFPCMAEPMVLALEERFEVYSVGKEISPQKILEIIRLSGKHGFQISKLTTQERVIDEDYIMRIKEMVTRKKRFQYRILFSLGAESKI